METINTRSAWRPVLRPIAAIVVAALLLQPLSVFAQDAASPAAQAQLRRIAQWQQDLEQRKIDNAQAALPQGQQASERTSRNLTRVHQLLKGIKARAPAASQRKSTRDAQRAEQGRPDEQAQLGELLTAIDADTDAVLADFAAQREQLVGHRVSAEILARHDQTQTELGQRASALRGLIGQWRQTPGPATLAALDAYFERYPATRASAPVDPAKLPWSPPKPNERAPAESRQAWWHNLYRDQAVQLAQAGGSGTGTGIQFDIPPEPGQAPSAADLAETDEVTLTAEIRAKAQELQSNPVAIHNWVRNHIEWVPSWGAIQSAQDTLDKKRGNAIDIASLEIALLRAAGIPARYQFGTVDIPATQAMNWTGSTDNAQAALQLMTQGGIAARGRTQGGQIQTIRFEHAWVQAYVHWTPGRGSRNASPSQHANPNAALNAWVALDASVKQYQYAPGMDLQAAVPLDAQALLDAGKAGATVNEEQGWVQNLNQAAIKSQLDNYQNRLKTYIDSQQANATVGEVNGKKIIPQRMYSLLAGVTPLAIVHSGLQTAAVPGSLQHRFSYTLSDNWGNALLSYTEATSKLVGKRLTLTYTPADQATIDLISRYLPKPHADGSPIQASELPDSLPGYLIRLKPRITLDGQVVAQGTSAITMGTGLQGMGGFTQQHDPTQWDLTPDASHIAGQATAISISAGGISARQLDSLKNRLEQTKNQLETKNTDRLTGEQISGDLLTAALWSWFGAAESHNRLSQNQVGIVENPGLSYGLFHVIADPIYSWGVVRKVTFPGVNIDIGHMRNLTWAKDNDDKKWVAYNRIRGQHMSALEHIVPERFFVASQKCNQQGASEQVTGLPECPQGISAVKAIGIAAAQGQKIYTITQKIYADNPGIVNSAISTHSSDTQNRVQQLLDAGYEVTIHAAPIAQGGWVGAGYMAIDPSTGAGAYTIEGGSNGGQVTMSGIERDSAFAAMASAFIIFCLMIPIMGPVALAIFGGLMYLSLKSFIEEVNATLETKPMGEQRDRYISGISILFILSNILKYGAATGNVAYEALGWLVAFCGTILRKLVHWMPDYLWPDKK